MHVSAAIERDSGLGLTGQRCGHNDLTDTSFIFTKQRRSHSGKNVGVEVACTSITGQEPDVYELDFGWLAGNLVAPAA
jgi:hypothetical protein